MRRIVKPVCLILTIALLLTCTASLAGCGKKHVHSGTLLSLRTDADSEIPCCGVFQCTECGETYEASVTCKDVGLPVVKIEGDLEGISKENKKTATVTYDGGDVSFTSSATLKWQGKITLSYPKKNFNIQFVNSAGAGNKVKLRSAWGKQSKYCLKANWDDYAGARNLVSAKLWGEIVHSRSFGDRLDALVNGGGMDGYPVLVYLNGACRGLYTMNTPKSRWPFGITKTDVHAGLLFCENPTASVTMHQTITDPNAPEPDGWKVEYCATGSAPEGIAWLSEGMNGLISFVLNSDDAAFRSGIGSFTEVGRVIDYMLFAYFICAGDNLDKNILWLTYDGKKYELCAYDLDRTWKAVYGTDMLTKQPEWIDGSILRTNLLFSRIMDTFDTEIRARYAELREELLSYDHVKKLFSEYLGQVPDFVRDAEHALWSQQAVIYSNDIGSLMQFFTERAEALDRIYGLQAE